MSFGRAIRGEWALRDDVVYLNHGGFGATPRAVLAAQDAWRLRLEEAPGPFMDALPSQLDAALERLGPFVGAPARDLVFVDNATTAVNAVLFSTPLAAGDEIVTTGHVYPGVRNALAAWAGRAGARVIEAAVPFPIAGPGAALDAVQAALSPRTRLAVVDHITSGTAVVLPVADIVAACRARGVPVLVDGAHAVGQLALDVEGLGADYYVSNCHKWLFAPRSCAFLYARPERQDALRHPVVSLFGAEGWRAAFHWPGTRDPTPFLSVTAALDFVHRLGFEAIRAYDHDLAARAAALLEADVGERPSAPSAMRASMVTVRVGPANSPVEARRVQDRLWERHRVVAPVFAHAGGAWVRVSAQVYNDLDDVAVLAEALRAGD